VCGRPKGARGKAPKAWPRRERDVAAMSRVRRARQGRGGGMARLGAQPGRAARVRTHARGSWLPRATAWPCRARGTGIPGPRHDATAVRRQRQRGKTAARRAPAQEVAQRPDGEREYPRAGYGRVIGIAGSTREKGGGCGRTNLNYTGSSTRVHSRGLQCASNGIIPWPVG
jgi:hypothetical protein